MNESEINDKNDGKRALFIVGIFLFMVISANMTMLYLAYISFDGLVEENYYKRSLNYQDEKDQEATQGKLGWIVKFQSNKNIYTISAKDDKGNVIKNAKVKLTFFRPTQAGFDQTYFLREISPGIYQKPVNLSLPGIWDVYIEVQKEKSKWKKKQRITT